MDPQAELERRRLRITSLEQEVKEKDEQIEQLEHSLRTLQNENRQAHEILKSFDSLVETRCNQAADYERQKFSQFLENLEQEKADLQMKVRVLERDSQLLATKQVEVEFLTNKLNELSGNYQAKQTLKELRQQREDNINLKRELDARQGTWDELTQQLEDLASENRVLREMAGVPDSYGFDLQELKLVEKQRVEEYRGRVRYLEEEVDDLLQQRTRLEHALRNNVFKSLTPEQARLVNDFTQNLLNGTQELPLDNRSKALLEEVERLKAQLELGGPTRGVSPANDLMLAQIKAENQELRELIMKLSGSVSTPKHTPTKHPLQLPPAPILNETDNKYATGHSHRFNCEVPVVEIYTGDASRDLAALQLQVVELVELLNRREAEEQLNALEIDELRKKFRDVLLVQQSLFTHYETEKAKWMEIVANLKTEQETTLQELRETRAKVSVYETNPNITEAQKKVALLDVNLIRLGRKYDCLKREEQDLRSAYHSIEAEQSEKHLFLATKLNQLREWRTTATHQLHFLFKQLQSSVSKESFEKLSREHQILKAKQSDWILREADLHKRLSTRENLQRENLELTESIRSAQDWALQLQSELDTITRRLSTCDIDFSQELGVIYKVIAHLRSRHVSAESVFAIVDQKGEGVVSKEEFQNALGRMGLQCSSAEFGIMLSLGGADSEGNLCYKEFINKLYMYGLKPASEEQAILQTIYTGIEHSGLTLRTVFDIFDSDGSGDISHDELHRSLKNLNVGLTNQQIDKVLRLIDTNKDHRITYQEFARIFETTLTHAVEVSHGWKDEFFARVYEAAQATGLDLAEAFAHFDRDKDGRLNKAEFSEALRRMAMQQDQIDVLWSTVNTDRDGFVSYLEFVAQLKASVKHKQANLAVEVKPQEARTDARRVALLEAREQAALGRAERYQARMKVLNQQLKDTEAQLFAKEDKFNELTRNYHIVREDYAIAAAKLQNCISKSESEVLRQENEKLRLEIGQTRAAVQTYKNLMGISADHARTLQLALEKRKDEVDTLQIAIREVQAADQDAATVSQLYHQVMVARWSEASANKKYDEVLSETRWLRTENFRLETQLSQKEQALANTQQVLTEKVISYEALVNDLQSKASSNLTLAKGEEFIEQIRDLAEKKTKVEETHRELLRKVARLESGIEEAKLLKHSAEEIQRVLKETHRDDMSQKILEMNQRLSQARVDQMKADRELSLTKEHEEHMNNVHERDQQLIRELEAEVADWETKLHTEKETWHKRDQERQKMLLQRRVLVEPEEDPRVRILGDEVKTLRLELKKADETIAHHQDLLQQRQVTPKTAQTLISPEDILAAQTEPEAASLAHQISTRILNLQDMVQSKIHQVSAMEETIQHLQQTLKKTKDQAAIEIQRLVQGIQTVKKSKGFQPEIEMNLEEKDKAVAKASTQAAAATKAKERLEKRVQALEVELQKAQLDLSQTKARPVSGNAKKEVEQVKKQLLAKDRELLKLKTSIGHLKEQLLKQAEANIGKPLPQVRPDETVSKLEAELRRVKKQLEEAKKAPPPMERSLVKEPRRSQTGGDIRPLQQQIQRLETENSRLKQEVRLSRPLTPTQVTVIVRIKQQLRSRNTTVVNLVGGDSGIKPSQLTAIFERERFGLSADELAELGRLFDTSVYPSIFDKFITSYEPPPEAPVDNRTEILNRKIKELLEEVAQKDKHIERLQVANRKKEREIDCIINEVEPLPPVPTVEGNAELEQLKEENFALKQEQGDLEIQVKGLQSEHAMHSQQIRRLTTENQQLFNALEEVRASRARSVEGIYLEELKVEKTLVKNLQAEIREFTERESILRQRNLELSQQNMTMKFEKDQHSLVVGRLSKQLKDLEKRKQLPAPDQQSTVKYIESIIPAPTQTHDSSAVTDSYKRLVERLRAENEVLKQSQRETQEYKGKLFGEEKLRGQLKQLEDELHEYRSRETINKGIEGKLKKVNTVNDSLRQEVQREAALVEQAEGKYRQLLHQHESLLTDYVALRESVRTFGV